MCFELFFLGKKISSIQLVRHFLVLKYQMALIDVPTSKTKSIENELFKHQISQNFLRFFIFNGR